MNLCVFTKHLQELSFDALARALKKWGVKGVDLTVRPGGHVEPEAVADDLPKAVQELKAHGVDVEMITTAFTSLEDAHAQEVLEAASREGIRWFKYGYYLYEEFGSLRKSCTEAKAKLKDLAALSKELGLCGGYHNHSGPYLGGNPLDVLYLIEDLDPEHVCAYYDVGHATVEGMRSGWLMAFDALSERIRMIALKDFRLDPDDKNGHGWIKKVVPMGEGVVHWKKFANVLKRIAPSIGPISLHCEYDLPAIEVLKNGEKDKVFFERWWGGEIV